MADIRDWGHRVTPTGTMLIHDSFSAIGVTLAQLRLLFLSREWRYVGRSRSMAEYQRASLTSAQQAENLLAQTRELGWFAVNVARKVLLVAGLRSIAKLLDGGRGEWPY